jgi:hypothetical protein
MNPYKAIEKGFTEYDNWRYLRNEKVKSMKELDDITKPTMLKIEYTNLTALLGNYYTISFPNMNIIKYINSNLNRKGIALSTQDSYHPEYCRKCLGAGKFDWISSITGPNHFNSRYEFKRDKREVLLYHKPNGKISKNHIWAFTEVYDGERICDECLGTGINLQISRYQFPLELRKSLVSYDIRYLLT